MTTSTVVCVGFALTILGSCTGLISNGALIYGIIQNDKNIVGKSIGSICVASGLTMVISALAVGLHRRDAMAIQDRRRVVFGPDNNYDPDRVRRVRVLRWLRLFGPFFPWAWILTIVIYGSLCITLRYTMDPDTALKAVKMGIPLFAMGPLSCILEPPVIESLEIIAGYTTGEDISMYERDDQG